MKKRYAVIATIFLILIIAAPITAQTKKQLTFLFMPGVQDPFYTTMEKGVRACAIITIAI